MEHSCHVSHHYLLDGVSINSRIWLNRMERHFYISNAINDCVLRDINGRYFSHSLENGISLRTVNKGHENLGKGIFKKKFLDRYYWVVIITDSDDIQGILCCESLKDLFLTKGFDSEQIGQEGSKRVSFPSKNENSLLNIKIGCIHDTYFSFHWYRFLHGGLLHLQY